jgi:hypothetical protein
LGPARVSSVERRKYHKRREAAMLADDAVQVRVLDLALALDHDGGGKCGSKEISVTRFW